MYLHLINSINLYHISLLLALQSTMMLAMEKNTTEEKKTEHQLTDVVELVQTLVKENKELLAWVEKLEGSSRQAQLLDLLKHQKRLASDKTDVSEKIYKVTERHKEAEEALIRISNMLSRTSGPELAIKSSEAATQAESQNQRHHARLIHGSAQLSIPEAELDIHRKEREAKELHTKALIPQEESRKLDVEETKSKSKPAFEISSFRRHYKIIALMGLTSVASIAATLALVHIFPELLAIFASHQPCTSMQLLFPSDNPMNASTYKLSPIDYLYPSDNPLDSAALKVNPLEQSEHFTLENIIWKCIVPLYLGTKLIKENWRKCCGYRKQSDNTIVDAVAGSPDQAPQDQPIPSWARPEPIDPEDVPRLLLSKRKLTKIKNQDSDAKEILPGSPGYTPRLEETPISSKNGGCNIL